MVVLGFGEGGRKFKALKPSKEVGVSYLIVTWFSPFVTMAHLVAIPSIHRRRERHKAMKGPLVLVATLLATTTTTTTGLVCPKLCNGHGRCDTGSRQCQCFEGWFGADCSMIRCPTGPSWADIAVSDDNAHNPSECSDRGLCDYMTGKCKCYDGFEGQVRGEEVQGGNEG